MNKALKGNRQEVLYTQELNKKNKFWNSLPYDKDTTFAIHINSKKYGILNESKIQPKADICFAKGSVTNEYLIQNDFYLSEDDVKKFNLLFISQSGVSVKLPNSSYTITKISPNTFIKIFGSNILGAGASIYCKKENEFFKNENVLTGWNVNEVDFIKYYKENLNNKIENINLSNKTALNAIKTYSNNKISEIINKSKEISDLIFKGIGNFEEPFTAYWIIKNDEILANYYIPYNITTGSGRSKGIYTIVLKPK